MPNTEDVPRTESLLEDNRNGARLDSEREYRYKLWRTWDVSKPALGFIMLNPSTADESEDDPTIRRCLGYAKDWGYGKIVVGNLFALRATDPSELRDHESPVGAANDVHLRQIADESDKVIAAWGANGSLQERGREVAELLEDDLYALDTTKDGHPVHPLYQPADAEPIPYSAEVLDREQ